MQLIKYKFTFDLSQTEYIYEKDLEFFIDFQLIFLLSDYSNFWIISGPKIGFINIFAVVNRAVI